MRTVIYQAIGFIGAFCIIYSFQCKSTRKLFSFQLASYAGYIVHYYLIGAYSGCYSSGCGLIRCVVLNSQEKKWAQWKGWLPTFIGLNLLGIVLTWKDVFSIFPAVALIATTCGSWSRNGKWIRLCNTCIACPAWLVYGIHTRSVATVLCELFILGSIGISFLRYGVKALDGDGEEKDEN